MAHHSRKRMIKDANLTMMNPTRVEKSIFENKSGIQTMQTTHTGRR